MNNDVFVNIYVTLIIYGRRTFESIPENLKPAVKARLIELGLGELCGEPAV